MTHQIGSGNIFDLKHPPPEFVLKSMKEMRAKWNLGFRKPTPHSSNKPSEGISVSAMMKGVSVAALVCALTAFTFGQQQFRGPDGYHFGLPIHWVTVDQGIAPQSNKITTALIYTPGQLTTFWHQYIGNRPMPQKIDWGRQMIIAVVGGNQPAGTKVQLVDIHHQSPGNTIVSWCFSRAGFGGNFGHSYSPTGYGSAIYTGANGPTQVIGLPPAGTVTPIDSGRHHGNLKGRVQDTSYITGSSNGTPFTIALSDIPTGTIHFQNLPPVQYGSSRMVLSPNCGYGYPGYGASDAWPWTVIGYGPGCFSGSPTETIISSPYGYFEYSQQYFDGWVNLPSSFSWYQNGLIVINPGIQTSPVEIRILGMRKIGPHHLELEYALVPENSRLANSPAPPSSASGPQFVNNPFAVVSIPRTNDFVSIKRINLDPQTGR